MSDNKRNIDDEYESFMAYLRGEAPAPENGTEASPDTAARSDADSAGEALGLDDEDDAFNVIDAVKEFESSRARRQARQQPQAAASGGMFADINAQEAAPQRPETPKSSARADSVDMPARRGEGSESAAGPVESGLFAGLDEFESRQAQAAEPAKKQQHRQPRYAAERYGAVASTGHDEAYLQAWRSIPEENTPLSGRRAAPVPVYAEEGNFISRRKSRRRRGRFKLLKSLAWLTACLMAAVALSIFFIQSCGDVFGYDSGGEDMQFTVRASDDLDSISERLSSSGLIDQKLTFRFYAKFKKATDGFTPGVYTLNPDMSYDEILALTRHTMSEEKKVVKITFREGLSVYEIADLLAENGVCDKAEFLDTLQNEDLGFDFIDQIPKDPLRLSRLEGYMFPDTYEFYVGEKTASVAKKFLNNFNNKITASMYKKMEERGVTLDQLVILASIVQKEAGRAKEMYRVSSVFHNRLDSNGAFPLLQSDTTTNYINDYIIPNRGNNQEMIDAYDTYTTAGLPAGPICCPGINALRAALDPAETPYYFFLSDEKGTYYYAETFAGHQNNAAKAARVGEGSVHGIGMDGRNG